MQYVWEICEDCNGLYQAIELPKGISKLTKDLCWKCYSKYDPMLS